MKVKLKGTCSQMGDYAVYDLDGNLIGYTDKDFIMMYDKEGRHLDEVIDIDPIETDDSAWK